MINEQTVSSSSAPRILRMFSPVTGAELPGDFPVSTNAEVTAAVQKASVAFPVYADITPEQRAGFLEAIGQEIISLGDELIHCAMKETGLPEARLIGERARTVGQLQLFASVLREGSWVEAVIDSALPERKPLPRSDIRKMLVPLGPVLIFGASNFPFAFSTAGGDTVSALAAGNPVIVKAHEGHLGTNGLVGQAVLRAAQKTAMPDGVFSWLVMDNITDVQELIINESIKAIGFTGSYKAGMSIYHTAVNKRRIPIPVYAEMSSVNPVVLLPQTLQQNTEALAAQLAGSITLGSGQFCTNPGLLFMIGSPAADRFEKELSKLIASTAPAWMLNRNVCRNFYQGKKNLLAEPGIQLLADVPDHSAENKGAPALAKVRASDFINNRSLQAEVFGPSSLIVLCRDHNELIAALEVLEGQLTGSIMGTEEDLTGAGAVISTLGFKVGRLLFNGVPTGVEVCHAMVHGGPFPSTTDQRTTSVGADAIKRFARPVCWQDCPQQLLPLALRNENELGLMRKVNGNYSREAVEG